MPRQVIPSGSESARPSPGGAADEFLWNDFLDAIEDGRNPLPSRWVSLFGLHRLRAVVDAVVVGIGTALADDPQLTVRLVAGRHPVRVVIDPNGRIPANAKLFAEDGVRRIVITTEHAVLNLPPGVEILRLPSCEGQLAPAAILQALARSGLTRILIEGGAQTLSGFIKAGCLDRVHVIVAPIILGSGRPGFDLTPIEWIDQAMRPPVMTHLLEGEVLFDCDLTAHRVKVTA